MKTFWNTINRFNELVAAHSTLAMSTMWCVYVFFVWSILPLIWSDAKDAVFYVSGGIIQLVALPLIMVGQNVLNRASEERAQKDHEALMEQIMLIRQLLENEKAQTKALDIIQDNLDDIHDDIAKITVADKQGHLGLSEPEV